MEIIKQKIKVGDWVTVLGYIGQVTYVTTKTHVRIIGFSSEWVFYPCEIEKVTVITEQEAIVFILKNFGGHINEC